MIQTHNMTVPHLCVHTINAAARRYASYKQAASGVLAVNAKVVFQAAWSTTCSAIGLQSCGVHGLIILLGAHACLLIDRFCGHSLWGTYRAGTGIATLSMGAGARRFGSQGFPSLSDHHEEGVFEATLPGGLWLHLCGP